MELNFCREQLKHFIPSSRHRDDRRMAWIRPPTRDMEDGESLDVGCSSPFLCHSTSGSLPAGIPRIELRELEPYLFGPLCGSKLPLIYHKSQASEDWLETNESEDEVRMQEPWSSLLDDEWMHRYHAPYLVASFGADWCGGKRGAIVQYTHSGVGQFGHWDAPRWS